MVHRDKNTFILGSIAEIDFYNLIISNCVDSENSKCTDFKRAYFIMKTPPRVTMVCQKTCQRAILKNCLALINIYYILHK